MKTIRNKDVSVLLFKVARLFDSWTLYHLDVENSDTVILLDCMLDAIYEECETFKGWQRIWEDGNG
jgi:hypothetical protein